MGHFYIIPAHFDHAFCADKAQVLGAFAGAVGEIDTGNELKRRMLLLLRKVQSHTEFQGSCGKSRNFIIKIIVSLQQNGKTKI